LTDSTSADKNTAEKSETAEKIVSAVKMAKDKSDVEMKGKKELSTAKITEKSIEMTWKDLKFEAKVS
jgi:hypothetical protein